MLISCGGKKEDSSGGQENILTGRSDSLTRYETENGVVVNRFYTPLMEEYRYAPEPYTEFRHGINIVSYDSLGQVKSTLVGNYAINYTNLKLWEVQGNVRATNNEGQAMETNQLYWNQATKRIYSNVDTDIFQGEDILHGEGFESDEEMKEWVLRRPRGTLRVDTEPTRDSTATATQDSLAAGSPEASAQAATPSMPEADGQPAQQERDEVATGADRQPAPQPGESQPAPETGGQAASWVDSPAIPQAESNTAPQPESPEAGAGGQAMPLHESRNAPLSVNPATGSDNHLRAQDDIPEKRGELHVLESDNRSEVQQSHTPEGGSPAILHAGNQDMPLHESSMTRAGNHVMPQPEIQAPAQTTGPAEGGEPPIPGDKYKAAVVGWRAGIEPPVPGIGGECKDGKPSHIQAAYNGERE